MPCYVMFYLLHAHCKGALCNSSNNFCFLKKKQFRQFFLNAITELRHVCLVSRCLLLYFGTRAIRLRSKGSSSECLTCCRISTSRGTRPASTTSWICESFPAVMLDSVHAASFWMLFFGWRSRLGNRASAPEFRTLWVCSSVPVTMFPIARNDGVCKINQHKSISIMKT